MDDKKTDGLIDTTAFTIDWQVPAGITRYANQVTVQMGLNECVFSFFEMQPPILLGSPEEVKAQASKLSTIRAECVSRVVIPKSLVPEVVKAISEVAEKTLPKQIAKDERPKED